MSSTHSRLALIGGEEFATGFEDVHASLLKDTGRAQPRLAFLPTCAADDGAEAIEYWCTTAREKFTALGAIVEAPRVVDQASANDPHYAQLIAEADLIYFGGGYPHVAMRILPETHVMKALQAALERGVLIAGSSGGAMLMGARSEVVTPELAEEIGRVWEHGAPPDWDPLG
jgi:cyanophycinase